MSSLRRKLSRGGVLAVMFLMLLSAVPLVYAAGGFDNKTNGVETQAEFNADRAAFEARDEISTGLGPIYNAQSCAECHQNPVSGSASQVNELRVGRFDGTTFIGGKVVSDRAIDPAIQEKPSTADNVQAFRVSLNLLGDGYVEVIDDDTIKDLRAAQAIDVRGTYIKVPVLEAPPNTDGTPLLRVGRFGWKDQHASLLSFSADAYRNEVGITNPLFPAEKQSNGHSVAAFDTFPAGHPQDPDDPATTDHPFGEDVEAFTRFIRSTKVPTPAPDPDDSQALADINAGRGIFNDIGCSECHTQSIQTLPAGTWILGHTYQVPDAIGGKTIHPYSDFLLHDIGTGDGIIQSEDHPETRNMIRTAPLWGLRLRNRLLHDGENITPRDAILRHAGQAQRSVNNYMGTGPVPITSAQRQQLLAFLDTL